MIDIRERSIGIFDSGFGGLSVMRKIMDLLPQENLVYFADTAHIPYGNKSASAIIKYSLESAHFLLKKKIKLLIVACNTASAYALDVLEKELSIPVLGVIFPAIEELMKATKNKKVAILGTEAMIRSGIYPRLIQEKYEGVEVESYSAPLFVPLVEEGFHDHIVAREVAKEYLKPLKISGVDTVLLACTHYPLLQGFIEESLGVGIKVVNPAEGCADFYQEFLSKQGLLNLSLTPAKVEYFVSDDAKRFSRLAPRFLGREIGEVLEAFKVKI
jgi:glutamate racemase